MTHVAPGSSQVARLACEQHSTTTKLLQPLGLIVLLALACDGQLQATKRPADAALAEAAARDIQLDGPRPEGLPPDSTIPADLVAPAPDIDPCTRVTCGANASCQRGTCQCDPGYQGDPATGCTPLPTTFPADFADVVWLHTDVSSWAKTATLSAVTISGSQICLDYNKADVWPGLDHVGAFVNANPWIFVHQDGTWYAATWEWLRFGQTCKSITSVAGDHIKQSPLQNFAPQSGTWYGFMVSGLARDTTRNVQERSQVVMFQWP